MNVGDALRQSGLSPVSRGILTAAGLVVIVAGMKASSAVALPVLVSIFVAMVCSPALFWLRNKGLPTALAVLIIVIVLLGLLSLVGVLIGSSLNDFYQALPTYREGLELRFTSFKAWIESFGIVVPTEVLGNAISPGAVMQLTATVLSGVGGMVTNSLVIMLIVVFMLFEASTVPLKLRAILPKADSSMSRLGTVAENVNRYLVIKTLVSLVTGIAAGVWLAILGVDFPVLWGLLAFLLNYVPNIGSIIAALPPALLSLVQFGPGTTLMVAIGYAVINGVLGNLVEPRLLGHTLGLSTLVVFLSLLVWQWVFGPVGMLLSVPLTMTLKIALESTHETRWLAVILASGREVAHLDEEDDGDPSHHQDTKGSKD